MACVSAGFFDIDNSPDPRIPSGTVESDVSTRDLSDTVHETDVLAICALLYSYLGNSRHA